MSQPVLRLGHTNLNTLKVSDVKMHSFSFARIPEIIFGAGKFSLLTEKITYYGRRVILLTGGASFKNTERFGSLLDYFRDESIQFTHYVISGEPSPENIDAIVRDNMDKSDAVVVAIGGGSVVDAGKAVSAMLGKKESVTEYLEGVGSRTHDGSKKPFIAVPTTSGTGSEATKNAVLSRIGERGFKKSLRHNNFSPDLALVDPELSLSCPPELTAACGMDAFTQLLESYVSTDASPMTDALAYSGISLLKDSLVPATGDGAGNIDVRSAMSYAALLSGITLANAGLGIVHGLASPIGSYYDIPHGVACGTLVGVATRINIDQLKFSGKAGEPGIEKYARIGKLLSGENCHNTRECCDYLIDHIATWIEMLNIPKLGKFGFGTADAAKIVAETGNKNNPVRLNEKDISRILAERI